MHRADTSIRDNSGLTPLMRAVEVGAIRGVQLLLEAGANIDAVDSTGRTALMRVAAYDPIKYTDAKGEPLFPETTFVELASLLLAAGANVRLKDTSGVNALMLAAECKHPQLLNVLLQADPSLLRDRDSKVGRCFRMCVMVFSSYARRPM